MHAHSCCDQTALPSTRRRFLTIASLGGGVALLGLAPRVAKAAGDVDSVVLSCMDYRLMDDVGVYLNKRGLKDNYDHLILAGASLGAVTNKYPHWGETFFEHVGLAIKLHNVHRAILIDHRDCGAYRLIFGKDTPGYASLLIAVLGMGAIQLVSIGIIGEYLGRLFLEVKGRPIYVIEGVYEEDGTPTD